LQTLNAYQSKFYAYELERSYASDHVGKLAGLLFDAQVEPKPHQIDAALFALQTPYLRGVILADEVGLGKTIEAGIVLSQYWAERKRRVLIVAPSSLRQQWQQELIEKFLIPSVLLTSQNAAEKLSAAAQNQPEVLICSYEFALRYEAKLTRGWDLIILDEAHRLRNHWTSKAKIAEAVSHIVQGASKAVLLTATPLQNRLEELYGLVSVFEPGYFYSLDAFRERYVKGLGDGDDLVERVALISKRTLRRDAQKYIQFTERLPLTLEFDPSPEEIELYNKVNEYLQRDELYAFPKSQRHLSALIIRKRLGSSTFAVASTLHNIASRVQDELNSGQRRDGRGALFLDSDLTTEEMEEAETTSFGPGEEGQALTSAETRQAIQTEIDELRGLAQLAESIKVNQKALRLFDAIDQGFERLKEIGAPEKAIIFTDSTKTQEYIAQALKENGRGEGLVLFNGSNDSDGSKAIYREWLELNKDSDLITGVVAADRRKALVDYFRDQGTLMIATEAAAEGINLQFCSMVVNYDLPWNPQRVEQRIGRAHRYGQKHNVIVVNFSNKGNIAEQRILQLLADKFHLFENVFGASDQVLGAIEDGLDFEKRISDILNKCRTEAEINAAFEKLEAEFSEDISREMSAAKARVFDNLDPNVQDRLKAYDSQSGEVLNKFERLLLAVTKRELRDYADFEGTGLNFVVNTPPVEGVTKGHYYFKSQPIPHAHQYRYSSPLAEFVIDSAQSGETPIAELTFSLAQSERASAGARDLVGTSGLMQIQLVTYAMKAKDEDISESYLVSAVITDSGEVLDNDFATDILDLDCIDEQEFSTSIDQSTFDRVMKERREQLQGEVQSRNARYYNEQEDLLHRNQQDRKAEHEAKIREYKAKEKEARKAANNATDPMEELRLKRESNKWDNKIDEADEDFRAAKKKMREEADKYLELIEQALKGTQKTELLFTVRWSVQD
jgi:ERCC4-related helicase